MPTARDGKHFPTELQKQKYEASLPPEEKSLADRGQDDFENAPGGEEWEQGAKHGLVMEHSYKVLGNGQHQISVKHADGYKWTQTHPEAFRAFETLSKAHGLDVPPPAIKTHMRARSQPTGPKEDERLRLEDRREPDEDMEGEE